MALCLLLCAVVFAQAANTRPAPGSYFSKPVSNVDELCRHIQQDPKVGDRFTKHFGMSVSALCTYFKENLKLSTLPKSGRYTEYFVDVHGRMVSHVKYVNRGVPVLVAQDGTPIIDMRCGNPMTKRLPKPIAKAQPKIVVKVEPQIQETPKPVLEPVVTPPPPPPVQVEPVTQVLAQSPQEISFSPITVVGAGVLALLPLVGGGAVTGENNVPAVPEPSGMVVLLSGISGLAVIRRRR